jgi:Pectate lyase superfamily protein/Secretion system C-terminal sorting domain
MKKVFNLVTVVLLQFPLYLAGQQWRSSLYPTSWTPPTEANNFYTDAFIQDFSYAGYHSGEKEIPIISSNIVDVTKAPYSADNTGVTDVTAKIQSAINKVQTDGGGVVFLPAGTYKISAGSNNYCLLINKGNVVLRGAGVGKTFLFNNDNNMRNKDIITVEGSGGNWKSQPSSVANITRDLNGPTSVIPVDNTSLFKVGDKIVLRQKLSSAWANEHKEPEWATTSYASSIGGIINFRVIKSINTTSKTITIDAPIRYAFKTRDEACVYLSPTTMIEEVGLEDFSIGNREVVTNFNDWVETGSTTDLLNTAENTATKGAYKCDASYVVGFSKALNSWMKNVSTYSPSVNQFKTQMLSNGIKLDQCRGVTVDNVDVGYAQYGGGGGNAYGFRIESNDCLIQNSKAEFTRHGFVFSFMQSSGNVLYNNVCKKSGKCTGNAPNGLNTGSSGSDFHMWFSPSNLIDNMTFDESYFSAVHRKAVANDHNAVSAHSVFWNTTGNNARASIVIRTSQTRTGYIMGTKGNTPAVDYKVSDNKGLAFRYDTDGARTNPEDKVEGIGKGADLIPQSLYLDQLLKRKKPITTSIEDIEVKEVESDNNIFPNPSNDGIFNLSKSDSWKVSSILGQEIKSSFGNQVDLSQSPKGVYLITINNKVERIVVE